MRLRYLLVTVILIHACVASAATSYTVVKSGDGPFGGTRRFAVVVDGDKIRATAVDTAEGQPVWFDSIIRDQVGSVIALNGVNSTWYELDDLAPFAPNSRLTTAGPQVNVRNVTIRSNIPRPGTGGTHVHAGELQYDLTTRLGGEKLTIRCTIRFEITADPNLPRALWLGRVLPVTGYAQVDEKLTAADSAVAGLPVRISLRVTRRYVGGPPTTESSLVQVGDIVEKVSADEPLFERPADYRHQRPVLGAPGGDPQ